MVVPTVVLVHGAWHGSWCWSNVVSDLESSGIPTIAVDLPGHDVPGSSARKWNTFSSYVDHVQGVLDSIEGPAVLVGHSMGGLVTQRVLETRTLHAGVLVASIPLRGAVGVVARLARNHPDQLLATLSLSLWSLVSTSDRVRGHLFTPGTDQSIVDAAGRSMQNESYPAFLSMLVRWPHPKDVRRHRTPISVIAAEHDAIFTGDEQRALARAYDTSLEVIDCGHDIMLESAWPQLVEHIRSVASR